MKIVKGASAGGKRSPFHGENGERKPLPRPGPRTVQPPPNLSCHTATRSHPPAGPLGFLWGAVLSFLLLIIPLLAPILAPDHFGCGLGCDGFIGMLPAFEEHECTCRSGILFQKIWNDVLNGDVLNGDEDELALLLHGIVEPL